MFLGQEVHYYMVYIAYFTELILQICDYAHKRRIFCENCKYALDKNFHGLLSPTKGCQVLPPCYTIEKQQDQIRLKRSAHWLLIWDKIFGGTYFFSGGKEEWRRKRRKTFGEGKKVVEEMKNGERKGGKYLENENVTIVGTTTKHVG